jgi:hypothetical protein
MRRLYIPALGDELTLAAPWSFNLKNERRNKSLIQYFLPTLPPDPWYGPPMGRDRMLTLPVTVPTGTVLMVDRIYIRAGAKDFDSVTFRCAMPLKPGQKKASRVRFFASLTEVNGMKVK